MDTPKRTLSLLIVDDNQDAADSLATLLELSGFRVRVAYCGADALTAAGGEPPDVAILDLAMPGMSGFDVARRLRALARPPLLVAMTGHGKEEDRARAVEAGFHLHLLKPADPATLVGLLNRLAESAADQSGK